MAEPLWFSNSICIIRVGWGSLALGNLCIPQVLFTVFVCLICLLSHKMCYLSLVCQASWMCLVCKSSCIHVVLAIDLYFVSVGACVKIWNLTFCSGWCSRLQCLYM